jgi:hypothetical protein
MMNFKGGVMDGWIAGDESRVQDETTRARPLSSMSVSVRVNRIDAAMSGLVLF